MNEHYNDNRMRSLYLRMLRQIWIVPVCAAVTAILFGLLYTGVIVTVRGQRKYTETATYYLDFAQNKETQKAYDYYNAATWDGLLFTHPGIFETIEKELPDGMTLQQADAFTAADLVSDIRVLTVVVTAPTKEETAGLSAAIADGLTQFGDSAKEFEKITFLSATEPALVVVSDRTNNAVLLGAVLGAIFSYLILRLYLLLDDAVYTPEEAGERYGLPVLGVMAATKRGAKADAAAKQLPEFLNEELAHHLQDLGIAKTDPLTSSATTKVVTPEDYLGNTDAAERIQNEMNASGQRAVIVTIPCGARGTCARTRHFLEQLKLRTINVAGLVLTEGDSAFLRRYYRDYK